MPYHLRSPIFASGEILVSPSVLLRNFRYHPLINRHLAGDWGEISDDDRACNSDAVADGSEILSQYLASDIEGREDLITIVTSADRSYTVVFLPGDPES